MLFAHDTEMNLKAAVALVNSLFSSPRDTDRLSTTDDLDEFFREHSYNFAPRATTQLLGEIQELRAPLRDLLTSPRDAAAETVNAWLSGAGALPQLVRHDALDWHVHAVPTDAHVPVQIRVETAMALIDLIRSDELSRLAVCADDQCEGIVLDLSRNRSRRFCSTTCGNRAAVAAYRARQA
ncbi:CGNR zinc finger domain-containing protein [Nocardioides jiangxiensis]|uniref:CGNR zinc finger domain-containing protein n=1 Tax=Nocardioides jiangxiensis TaxID=3064524 RepID=A0ABT9AXU7_9ACTN|nr:CGNR zinc finger domain-containing protein [Nocardioides sp. WY-20]MDO7867294.1 CGNR zinc finger domain-containing protein [Nocardioides sp. WY-20]